MKSVRRRLFEHNEPSDASLPLEEDLAPHVAELRALWDSQVAPRYPSKLFCAALVSGQTCNTPLYRRVSYYRGEDVVMRVCKQHSALFQYEPSLWTETRVMVEGKLVFVDHVR